MASLMNSLTMVDSDEILCIFHALHASQCKEVYTSRVPSSNTEYVGIIDTNVPNNYIAVFAEHWKNYTGNVAGVNLYLHRLNILHGIMLEKYCYSFMGELYASGFEYALERISRYMHTDIFQRSVIRRLTALFMAKELLAIG